MEYNLFNTWIVGERVLDNSFDSVVVKNFRLRNGEEVSFVCNSSFTMLVFKNQLQIDKLLIEEFVKIDSLHKQDNNKKDYYLNMALIVGKIYYLTLEWLNKELKDDNNVLANVSPLDLNDNSSKFDFSIVSIFIRNLYNVGFIRKDIEDIVNQFSDELYNCISTNSNISRKNFDIKTQKIINNVFK